MTDIADHNRGFGRELRSLRGAAGLTQEELAQRTGMSVRAISDIERGRTRRPQRETRRRLSAALARQDSQAHRTESGPGPRPVGAGAGRVVPRELPATVRHFTGRAAELAQLSGRVASAAGHAVVITALGGTAGVGKTALAIQWAHTVSDEFPDGQLYVNLRGYDPADPMTPADALGGFLRSLGTAGADIPADLDQRAAIYRSLLAGRRVLVVLDNASSAEQVRPLLPGTPGSHAVVTSRDSLPGLVARDGAERLELDRLPVDDAVQILRALIGGRVDGDPQSAAVLARQCSCLPLALRVAAELAVARPAVPLADLVTELAGEQRLELLDAGGDARTSIRAVFSWSCRNLDAAAVRAFGLLGLHPGPDLDSHAAAALIDTTLERAAATLDELTRAHLVQPAALGRYGMHDLLGAYARELVSANTADVDAATSRLVSYYRFAAAAAMDAFLPAGRPLRPRARRPRTPVPSFADSAAARQWLDQHRVTLVPVIADATDCGKFGDATSLAATVFRYLESGGYHEELLAIYDHAQRAAQLAGDVIGQAEALNNITVVDMRQGRYEQAVSRLGCALELYRERDHLPGQTKVLGNLGIMALLQGRYQQSVRYQRQALDLYRSVGDRAGEARTLNNLGLIELRLGRYGLAEGYLNRALARALNLGQQTTIGHVNANLGAVMFRQGRAPEAAERLQHALAIVRELRDPNGETYVLCNLGDLDLSERRFRQAADDYELAVALARRTGNRAYEANALNGLGDLQLALGDHDRARARHTAALGLADQIGEKYEQARAHDGLASGCHAAGDDGGAGDHWRAAAALFTELGAPEASVVRTRLRRLTQAGQQ